MKSMQWWIFFVLVCSITSLESMREEAGEKSKEEKFEFHFLFNQLRGLPRPLLEQIFVDCCSTKRHFFCKPGTVPQGINFQMFLDYKSLEDDGELTYIKYAKNKKWRVTGEDDNQKLWALDDENKKTITDSHFILFNINFLCQCDVLPLSWYAVIYCSKHNCLYYTQKQSRKAHRHGESIQLTTVTIAALERAAGSGEIFNDPLLAADEKTCFCPDESNRVHVFVRKKNKVAKLGSVVLPTLADSIIGERSAENFSYQLVSMRRIKHTEHTERGERRREERFVQDSAWPLLISYKKLTKNQLAFILSALNGIKYDQKFKIPLVANKKFPLKMWQEIIKIPSLCKKYLKIVGAL